MKKLAVTLVSALSTALALVAAPVIVAPAAHADACAAWHGRHLDAGGCTDALGHPVLLVPVYVGQPPCYTADGQAYYTPDGDPC
jgi:hypothetical protein